MKKWTKEERYRVLRSADEIRPLHEKPYSPIIVSTTTSRA